MTTTTRRNPLAQTAEVMLASDAPLVETTDLHYDYTQVAEDDRDAVKRAAVDIKRREKRAAMDIVEIGRQLADVKSRLDRGQFPAWLEVEFGWEQRMAYNFMAVAENFAKFAKIENFGLSALYLLSGPSVPDAAIEQANAVAVTGAKVTHRQAKTIIEDHRPQRAPFVPVESDDDMTLREAETLRAAPTVIHKSEPSSPAAKPKRRKLDDAELRSILDRLENAAGAFAELIEVAQGDERDDLTALRSGTLKAIERWED